MRLLRQQPGGSRREEAPFNCGVRNAECRLGAASTRFHSALRTPHSAVNLLEVVLAISIAIAILVVALAFHQQAATLRGSLLDEAERLAAVRQIMDRLAADLRVAPVHNQIGFTGDSNSLRFVTTRLPLATAGFDSDLRRVTYRATLSGEATNLAISGLLRLEEPAVEFVASALAPATAATPAPELAGDAAEELAAGITNTTASATGPGEPLTEAIRFLNFRFWDGNAWLDSWSGVAPPPGVEVSLGFEPLPADLTPDLYPGEIFRRVIFLPAGQPKPAETNLVARINQR
jgi:type II secretory pathway component PulJ